MTTSCIKLCSKSISNVCIKIPLPNTPVDNRTSPPKHIENEIECFRGADSRPQYQKVSSLRSSLTDTPLLGLSATVTTTVVNDILNTLHLQREDVIIKSLPPDRPNIFTDVTPRSTETVASALAWLINDIENK